MFGVKAIAQNNYHWDNLTINYLSRSLKFDWDKMKNYLTMILNSYMYQVLLYEC